MKGCVSIYRNFPVNRNALKSGNVLEAFQTLNVCRKLLSPIFFQEKARKFFCHLLDYHLRQEGNHKLGQFSTRPFLRFLILFLTHLQCHRSSCGQKTMYFELKHYFMVESYKRRSESSYKTLYDLTRPSRVQLYSPKGYLMLSSTQNVCCTKKIISHVIAYISCILYSFFYHLQKLHLHYEKFTRRNRTIT